MSDEFTFGSLFAGIGGFDLGLEWAGMKCIWQVEINDHCQKVLAKHWPNVPRYGDIKDVGRHNLETPDLVCGGFPCQPVSFAGKRKGQSDPRWLWPEFTRVVSELRPGYVLVENVPGLLRLGMGDILVDLAEIGYDAEWDCLPASAFGAWHRRDRVWIVGYRSSSEAVAHTQNSHRRRPIFSTADSGGWNQEVGRRCIPGSGTQYWSAEPDVGGTLDGFSAWLDRRRDLTRQAHKYIMASVNDTLGGIHNANAEEKRTREILRALRSQIEAQELQRATGGLGCISATEVLFTYVCKLAEGTNEEWLQLESEKVLSGTLRGLWYPDELASASHQPEYKRQFCSEYPDLMQTLSRLLAQHSEKAWVEYRQSDANTVRHWESGIARIASGVPFRTHRLRALGNAVVPQVAEWIGHRIMEVEHAT